MKNSKTKFASFDVSKEDSKLIHQIVQRAGEILSSGGTFTANDRLTFEMDITACHANRNPLRLQELLDAPRFVFMHDVMGIHAHIDRRTGELKDCFSPRLSVPDHQEEP